jgi:tetratricopeptide (TPR) repeat protein
MKFLDLKSRVVKVNVFHIAFYILPLAMFLSGCTAIQASGELQPGRYALMRGDAERALAHFQRAAEIDPNAAVQHGPMKEGVWTYVGRAQYAGGDFAAAGKALEQAKTRYPDDSLAPLYLGLALSRAGDRQRGLKEIQTGLTGLGEWFEYMEYYTLYGAYWDPGRIIRSRIEKDLAATQGKEINWTDLIASVEHVGMEVEREADAVKEQLRRERRDSAKGDDRGN